MRKKQLNPKALKEKICDALEDKPHEFWRRYTKTISGTAVIMAHNLEEAEKLFDDCEYDMEDDDEDIDWDEIEDSDE
jgi:hypothetical protein